MKRKNNETYLQIPVTKYINHRHGNYHLFVNKHLTVKAGMVSV